MKAATFLGIAMISVLFASDLMAHCQIPCGIYDDHQRAIMMAEHITTIEKSMKQIETLSDKDPKNYNQLVRWANNKDHHADELIDICTYYFMSQRLKPADKEDSEKGKIYLERLTLLHEIMVEAMVAKRNTDLSHIEKLRELLNLFEISYFGHKVEH